MQSAASAGIHDLKLDQFALKGNMAVVAYANNTTELFYLNTLSAPQSLGTIAGLGGKLSLSDSGLLFSEADARCL